MGGREGGRKGEREGGRGRGREGGREGRGRKADRKGKRRGQERAGEGRRGEGRINNVYNYDLIVFRPGLSSQCFLGKPYRQICGEKVAEFTSGARYADHRKWLHLMNLLSPSGSMCSVYCAPDEL